MDMEDPQGKVRTCLFQCAWHWSNRFPDVFCTLQSVTQMLFWGHAVISSILFNNLLVSWREKCVFVCVFLGSPLGRGRAVIACSSPGAGYGHPGHVSCNGAKHRCASLCFHSNTRYFPISSDVFWPPTLTSVSPKAHSGFHLHIYFCNLF